MQRSAEGRIFIRCLSMSMRCQVFQTLCLSRLLVFVVCLLRFGKSDKVVRYISYGMDGGLDTSTSIDGMCEEAILVC